MVCMLTLCSGWPTSLYCTSLFLSIISWQLNTINGPSSKLQIFNFCVVPSALRVTYVNVVTLVWTVYLSYMKHKVGTFTIVPNVSFWV